MVLSHNNAITLFKKYGSYPFAYSTLQPELNHFHINNTGYIAYFTYTFLKKHYTAVLGDPIAPKDQWCSLLKTFTHQFPNVNFYSISTPCHHILSELGLSTHHVGWDIYWTPNNHPYSKRALQRATRTQQKQGVTITEESISDHDFDWIHNITQQWLKHRPRRYTITSFFCRPLQQKDTQLCRWIIAKNAQNIPIGFCVLDPIYKNNHCIAYAINHLHYLPKFPYLPLLLRHHAKQYPLSLGPVTSPQASILFRHNVGYPFKNLRETRCRYPHIKKKNYFATTCNYPWWTWITLFNKTTTSLMKKNKNQMANFFYNKI